MEILYFIGRPIMREIKFWLQQRHWLLATRRTIVSASVAATAVGLCLVPWSTRVEIPAVVESVRLQPIHPGRPARIEAVQARHGASVKAGDVLVTLVSPDIDQEIELARIKLALARLQYGRRGADASDRASTIVLESSIASLMTKIEGLEKEREEMRIKAPFDGRIVELDPALHPGRWVSPHDQLALLAADDGIVAKGYVSESDLWRIAPGGVGTFVPEQPLRESMAVRIEQVAASGAAQIEIAQLASIHSGRIAVATDEKQRLVPTTAQYLVHMSAAPGPHAQELSVRGVVLAEGKAQSLLARVWRQTLKVLMRESGA